MSSIEICSCYFAFGFWLQLYSMFCPFSTTFSNVLYWYNWYNWISNCIWAWLSDCRVWGLDHIVEINTRWKTTFLKLLMITLISSERKFHSPVVFGIHSINNEFKKKMLSLTGRSNYFFLIYWSFWSSL